MTTPRLAQAIHSARTTDSRRLNDIAMLTILDGIGVGLAGSSESAGRIAASVMRSASEGPSATVWGTDIRLDPLDAALVNGVSIHVLDLDDTNSSIRGHPTAPLVPAILAVAETIGATGSDIVDAFIVGFETECKLGHIMNLEHYERGWHTTSTLGTVGVAAAIGKLLKLSPERLTSALAIACSFSSGLVRNFGSMTKSLHVGHAARCGILAARLAEGGFTGNDQVMEKDSGFIEIFSGEPGAKLDWVIDSFGKPWDIIEPGVIYKLYPSCSLTHPAIDAAIEIFRKYQLRPDQIERVDCFANYRGPTILTFKTPTTSLQAKFSMEYALAVTLCDGEAGIDQFGDERVNRPDVQELLPKIHSFVHPDLRTRESLVNDFTIVRVTTTDGKVVEETIRAPLGSPQNPVSDQVLVDKFESCAMRVIPSNQAKLIPPLVRSLTETKDVSPLFKLLAVG